MAEVTESQGDAQPTAASARDLTALGQISRRKPRTLWRDAFRQFRKHHLAVAGAVILLILILAVVLAGLLAIR